MNWLLHRLTGKSPVQIALARMRHNRAKSSTWSNVDKQSRREKAIQQMVVAGATDVPSVIEALREEISNQPIDNATIQIDITEALVRFGVDAVPSLITALQHGDQGVRFRATEALGRIRDKRAVEPLISALSDPEELVRSGAAGALGRLGDARAVPDLCRIVIDLEEGKRGGWALVVQTAHCLAEIGDFRAIALLIEALDRLRFDPRDPLVAADSHKRNADIQACKEGIQNALMKFPFSELCGPLIDAATAKVGAAPQAVDMLNLILYGVRANPKAVNSQDLRRVLELNDVHGQWLNMQRPYHEWFAEAGEVDLSMIRHWAGVELARRGEPVDPTRLEVRSGLSRLPVYPPKRMGS